MDDKRRRPVDFSGRRMSEKEKEEYRKRQRRIQKRREEIEKENRSRRVNNDNTSTRNKVRDIENRRPNEIRTRRINSNKGNIPLNDRRRMVLEETQNNPNSRKPINRRELEEKRKLKKKNSRKKIIKKTIIALLLILVLFIGWTIVSVFGFLSKITNTDMIKPVPVDMNETVNILLLGLDVGDVNNPNVEDNKRTDTIMVLNYNPTTKKVQLVSIPRDTLIHINGNRWKINAAYPIGGDERVIEEVEKLLDIKINYLAKVNYKAFRDFIDAIGGVDMKIKHDMHYTDKSQNLKIDFDKGTTEHLDGKKAEEFFRWRKNNDGTGLQNGDLDRIQNQHEFIEKVVQKCTKPSIIFRIPKILKSIGNNVETNMPGGTMLKYGIKFIGLNSKDIVMTTVKGTPKMIGGQSYVVVTKDENRELIEALNSNSGSFSDLSRDNIKIKVLNGTKIGGLAASYQIELNQKGYSSVTTGNTDLANKTTVMVNNEQIKEMLKKDIPNLDNYKDLDEDEYPQYDVVVILGSDAKTS